MTRLTQTSDKGTKGKLARVVPIIPVIRPFVDRRLAAISDDSMARLFTFTGPRAGRVSTAAVLRDATHWDEVVTKLGYGYLLRHGLRHTGLTWMADAGVPVHVLRKIAGHGSLPTTQRYLHPDHRAITEAGRRSVRTSAPDEKGPGPRLVPRLFEKSSGRRDLNPRPLDPSHHFAVAWCG
jgi:integrase